MPDERYQNTPTVVTTDISQAARALRQGRLVAFPTETVYGLGANAWDADAVARVFAVKQRPFFDPLIVHLGDFGLLPQIVRDVPPLAQRLIKAFWPGPLTLVLPKQPRVPDLVTSGLPTVAVRMPSAPLARRLLRMAAVPVAAPSANLFGRVSPTDAEAVVEQLAGRIPLVLDGGVCSVGVESTVVQPTANGVLLLRPGGVPTEAIEGLGIPVHHAPHTPTETADAPVERAPSPGMLPRHYAPRTPLKFFERPQDVPAELLTGPVGWLALGPPPAEWADRFVHVETLSPEGSDVEAARNLFAALRRLDAGPARRIIAIAVPNTGLGRAINDRLRRAATST
ncbi:MAG: threonylcarbamoyl-AMP synthase [Planctomycetota bacterium]|nr:MAG: threonylcarbamoyl-AMP synthase [Planctomycetota bacterium]